MIWCQGNVICDVITNFCHRPWVDDILKIFRRSYVKCRLSVCYLGSEQPLRPFVTSGSAAPTHHRDVKLGVDWTPSSHDDDVRQQSPSGDPNHGDSWRALSERRQGWSHCQTTPSKPPPSSQQNVQNHLWMCRFLSYQAFLYVLPCCWNMCTGSHIVSRQRAPV